MEINKTNIKLINAAVALFKAVPVKKKVIGKVSRIVSEMTIANGFVFSPVVFNEYSDYEYLINIVKEEYGLTAEQLNSSFHKSWEKVSSSTDQQLFMEQMIHYLTTYGFENMGIYDEASIYIPNEQLDIPGLEENVKLMVIRGYTNEELKDKVINMLSSGIALKEQTMKDLMTIINYVGFSAEDIEKIKNKEVKIQLYDRLGILPENPTEFLRYLVYKYTGETLLIKNKYLIEKIKDCKKETNNLISKYSKEYGLEKLATIFYRFKPLFLAFKSHGGYRTYINKIRKLAKKHHKPMDMDFLNSITSLIKDSNKIPSKILKGELEKVNTFRKIRLAYALKYRTTDANSILYRVRNGKSYAKEFSFENKEEAKRVLKLVLKSIIEDVNKNVNGKKVYLPENMNYTLPATEKMFTGNFPSGSYVETKDNMIVGVNWYNTDGNRIDLDLSIQSVDGKIGWDSDYRNDERTVLYSGDMTSAGDKNGATESYYIKKQPKNPYILTLNYYNYDERVPVPFKIFVATEEPKRFGNNYMVNPNNIITTCKTKIDQKQIVLGLIIPTTNGSRFYFTETGLGNTNVSSDNEYTTQARNYLINQYNHSIELKDILEKAGAVFVDKEEDAEINLSVEALEKDTILELLK